MLSTTVMRLKYINVNRFMLMFIDEILNYKNI